MDCGHYNNTDQNKLKLINMLRITGNIIVPNSIIFLTIHLFYSQVTDKSKQRFAQNRLFNIDVIKLPCPIPFYLLTNRFQKTLVKIHARVSLL